MVTQDRKDTLGLCMALTDWSSVYCASSVEDKVTSFNNIMQTMLDTCIPYRKKKTRNVDKHWMTDNIKAALEKRQSVFQKEGNTPRWKKLRNQVQSLIRKQKKYHYNMCIANLKKQKPRDWWNFMNNELGRTQKSK
ncbi:Hypp9506 [Branchiostoma lanceolatum]|uniref:Hypp9506 protein n=1 Tax=Branchiostoma lanceolatum TaxID=7740 RepID=A0A8S4MN67_BRALA|nr:Hypp9506 [Branchiostoma lanceolatum]